MLSQYASQFLKPVEIPEGTCGDFSISKFTILPEQASRYNINSWMDDSTDRRVYPGTYTQLKEKGVIWMSDTPAEMRDHAEFVLVASGDILITGLGLGMVAAACLRKPEVTSVTVVERQAEVIQLVESALQLLAAQMGKKLTVVNGDAYAWKPTHNFRFAWHDIWPTICADNLQEMMAIQSHYQPWVDGAQECWAEELVQKLAEDDEMRENFMGLGRTELEPVDSVCKKLDGFKI